MFDLFSAFAQLHGLLYELQVKNTHHITRQLCACGLRSVVHYSAHSCPQSCNSFDQRHGSIALVGSRTTCKCSSCHVCNCYNLVSKVRVGNEIVTVSNAISSPKPSHLMDAHACAIENSSGVENVCNGNCSHFLGCAESQSQTCCSETS